MEATALLGNLINPSVPSTVLGNRDTAVEKSKIRALTEPTLYWETSLLAHCHSAIRGTLPAQFYGARHWKRMCG